MSLVLIGCMKLELFANCAEFLLAVVFFFFFSLQHHDFFWQDMCQSSFCLSMSFSSSFFSMLLVFLGWSASWLYFSSHSFTRYCSFCALLLGQSLPCMLKLMLVRMQRLFRGCTGRTLSLMLRNICEG